MRYPPGYTSSSRLGWCLAASQIPLWTQASKPDLVQSSSKVLGNLGFLRSEFDHAVFIFKRAWGGEEVHCLVAMHVDDGWRLHFNAVLDLHQGRNKEGIGIKDLGPLRNFLGVQFERNLESCELWIHQEVFIDSLLAEYNLTNCNAVKTPLDSDHPSDFPPMFMCM